jgi:ATP-dependent Clp protease ATP-binding subunit ClpX
MDEDEEVVSCAFCSKVKREVKRLITGDTGACICNECIGLCNGILVDAGDPVPVSLPRRASPEPVRTTVEVK